MNCWWCDIFVATRMYQLSKFRGPEDVAKYGNILLTFSIIIFDRINMWNLMSYSAINFHSYVKREEKGSGII